MIYKECLETLNNDRIEDSKFLDIICRNVSKNFCEGGTNKYKINMILSAFDNKDCVLEKFEMKYKDGLDEIKKYILGCKLDKSLVDNIEDTMKKWGLFFENIGVEDSIRNFLVERYREEYNIALNYKKKYVKYQYLDYMLLIKNLKEARKEKQLKILENLKKDNDKIFNWFGDFLIRSEAGKIVGSQQLMINEDYIKKLQNEEFLLNIIKEIYLESFKACDNYNYQEDLKKIYTIQKDVSNWVDITKLNNLISKKNLDLLKEAHLINETEYVNRYIYQLTEIGFAIANNCFMNKCTSHKYLLEADNKVLIPFDSNPLILSKYIFNEEYKLIEEDFLFVFERKKI